MYKYIWCIVSSVYFTFAESLFMPDNKQVFINTLDQSAKQKDDRAVFSEKAAKYFSVLEERKRSFSDMESSKKRASYIRWKTIENLDKYLIEFEAGFNKNGGKIIWAENGETVLAEVKNIANQSKLVFVEGKHQLNTEIGLDNLQSEVVDDIKSVCIAEADFLIADAGGVCISQADSRFFSAPIKIIVAGIESLLPSLNDLDLFLSIQTTYTEQTDGLNSKHIFFGGMNTADMSSDEEVHLILMDNNRSQILTDEVARQTLWCTGCNACSFADAVVRIAGTEVYPNAKGTTIEAAKLSFKGNLIDYFFLSEAQPLDNYSAEVCPVNIDFTKIFLHTRKLAVEQLLASSSEKWFYFFWKKAMLKRNLIKLKGIKTLGYFVNKTFNTSEKNYFVTQEPASKSFNEQWRNKMKM